MSAKAITAGAAVLIVGGAVAACGSGVSGKATASSAIFDPCRLTAAQMAVVGDDLTESKFNYIGPQDEESRSCSWGNDWYSVSIESFAHTFDETRKNSAFAQLTPIDIPGREQAARFTSPDDTFQESCGVVIGVPQGVIAVDLSNSEAITGTSSHNTCDKAVEITEKLDRYFPR